MNRKEFEKIIDSKFDKDSKKKIMIAYKLSKYGHKNQFRDGGERYFNHPRRVALILLKEAKIMDPNLIIGALIHDLLEDSFILSSKDISLIFGDQVEETTCLLTKNKDEKVELYFSRLKNGLSGAKTIKIADRLDNLREMTKAWDEARIAKYKKETLNYIIPLAEVNCILLKKIKKLVTT